MQDGWLLTLDLVDGGREASRGVRRMTYEHLFQYYLVVAL